MPFTLEPLTRRTFLKTAAGVGAALALPRWSFAADSVGPAVYVALLSDTHIAGDVATVSRGNNMADNLRKVVAEVLAAEPKPTVAFINGDLALLKGEAGDYATVGELIKPLRQAGLTIHMTLGNHDHRENFLKAMYGDADREAIVPDKYVAMVPVGNTNWFLLDSLNKTHVTPGVLGEAQLKWLDESLKQHADQPAVVMVHHDTDRHGKRGGLTDSAALYAILEPHAHVKAVFFGHTHVWQQAKADAIQLINLPAVAYFFGGKQPLGWTGAMIEERKINLTLHAINCDTHDGEQIAIAW